MRIILASKSPRRQALLARITNDFVVIPSHAHESSIGTPREQVLTSARSKAHAVGETHHGVILGADTIVVLGDDVMGKPRTRSDAESMLRALSGHSHTVLTGLHLWNTTQNIEREWCAETRVRFREITEEEMQWYLDSGEYSDKAGAYAVQGRAAIFVASIHGEYTNVMGLPLCELSRLLREVGVTL
ncbi:septum formation protein Maf [Candidatus Bipolaricaulota bacterium]|nr:septum formation protein Maf [Candidatus Bipolaricaulota bacterium]